MRRHGHRRFAFAAFAAALAAVAGASCESTELAYGDVSSIIAVAPPELWEQVEDTVLSALQPAITTTVETEEIFRVTYQDPGHEHWSRLRRFRQMLLIGTRDDPWMQEALEKVRGGDEVDPPAVLQTRDVWARNQGVTILLLPEGAGREAVVEHLPRLREMYTSGYRQWAVTRMFVSGRDTALADTLATQAGFSLLLPEVYYWDRQDSAFIFRNDNPDPAELIRQVLVTWRSPVPTDMQPENLLAWRQDLAERYYRVPQLHDLQRVQAGPTQHRGKEAYQIQAVWQNPPGVDWPAAGPFILRAVICPQQNRMYLLDAWLYAPGKDKYEYMVQLETILDSFRCGSEGPSR